MVNQLYYIKWLIKLLNTDHKYHFVINFCPTQNVHARNASSVAIEVSY
jgi:hypothetical protein